MPQQSATITALRRCGPLGFGTGLLHVGSDEKASIRLLNTAIDLGVTYFDTAPLYGVGAVEAIVGRAVADRRNEIKLASKAGILPNPRGVRKRILDRAAVVLRAVPSLRATIPPPEPAYPIFSAFDAPRLRASVEASLRALRTDRLDVLLLHECAPNNAADPEVLGLAESLKQEGKIVAYGVAPTVEQILNIRRAGIRFGDIVQFANNVRNDLIASLRIALDELAVTHSCLGSTLRETLMRLAADPAAAARWRDRIGVDPLDGDRIAQLFLAHAMTRNPSGIVLFSSNSLERLRVNVLARDRRFAPEQVEGLAGAVGDVLGHHNHARIDPPG